MASKDLFLGLGPATVSHIVSLQLGHGCVRRHFFFEGFDHPIYTDLGLTSSSDHGPASLYIYHYISCFCFFIIMFPKFGLATFQFFLVQSHFWFINSPVIALAYYPHDDSCILIAFRSYLRFVIHSSMVQPPTNARYYPSNPKMVWWLNSKQLDGKIMLGNWYEQSIFFDGNM